MDNIGMQMSFTLQRYEFFSKSQQYVGVDVVERDVVYLAKVRIFSKSQQEAKQYWAQYGCRLPCKGTNFLANYNNDRLRILSEKDVVHANHR